MKRVSICSAVALAILWAGGIALAKDATNQKATTGQKQTTEAKDAKKTLTPQERKLEAFQKAHEAEMAPWKEVLKVAEEEKATKTVAAIDKIIKTKEEAYKRELARLEKQATTQEKATSNGQTGASDATKSTSKTADKKPANN